MIGAHLAHKKELGNGVTVAVIDEGSVECKHFEFQLSGSCSTHEYPGTWYPFYSGHATHVATTIAADKWSGQELSGEIIGVAPKASILAYDYLGTYEGNLPWNAEDWFIKHAFRNKARVVNMSYGPAGPKGAIFFPRRVDRMYSLIPKYKQMVFVKAAGNDGVNLLGHAVRSSLIPHKHLKNLILVGNVSRNRRIHPSSNRPGNDCFRHKTGGEWKACKERDKFKYFFVVAPGTNIRAASVWNREYMLATGTSMAAPHVTGVVALLQGQWPVLKNRGGAVANIIFRTAKDLGARGVDPVYGWGLVRADRALSPLGKKYLKKNNKTYSLSNSNVSLSNALSALSQESVTIFDEYDRDFRMSLPSKRIPIGRVLRREMNRPILGNGRIILTDIDNSEWSFRSSTSETPHKIHDYHWQFKLPRELSNTSIGYGNSVRWFNKPSSLAPRLDDSDATTASANPVLQLASDGLHARTEKYYGKHLSLAGGLATNNYVSGGTQPNTDATAMLLSLTGFSVDKKVRGNITVTNLVEDNGVLGTQLTGAFSLGGVATTTALTFNGETKIGNDYIFSTSYTRAQTDTGDTSGGILDMDRFIKSNSIALGISKDKVFDRNDRMYLGVSQPLRISGGSAHVGYGERYDEGGYLHHYTTDIDLVPTGREVAFHFGYVRNVKKSGKLMAGIYYSTDYNHVAGNTDTGFLVKFEWAR